MALKADPALSGIGSSGIVSRPLQAAGLVGQIAPRFRSTPELVLRVVGLFIPAAAEMIEMGYSYRERFEMDDSNWRRTFGDQPTDWDTALRATIDYWRQVRPGK